MVLINHYEAHGRTITIAPTCERKSMVCVPVRRDNPRALARGLSTVQAHKPCSISLVPQ